MKGGNSNNDKGNNAGQQHQRHEHRKLLMHSYLHPINPTEEIHLGRDLKFTQVAAGGKCSFAREISLDEALVVKRGLSQLKDSISALRILYRL